MKRLNMKVNNAFGYKGTIHWWDLGLTDQYKVRKKLKGACCRVKMDNIKQCPLFAGANQKTAGYA